MSAETRAIIFGEVLFDVFPGGRRVLGGAPFNVAWNLCGLGHAPLFISAVGDDEPGAEVRAAMARWGLSDEALQTAAAPTGSVAVSLEGGQPTYKITSGVAYDAIDAAPAVESLSGRAGLLYHGSLALRGEASRAALEAVSARCDAPRFIDVNLRAPHFDLPRLRTRLRGCAWLKVNDEELAVLMAAPVPEAEVSQAAEALGVRELLVTRGERGATWVAGRQVTRPAAPVPELVDAVGAGDAFAAVCIFGLLEGWPRPLTLQRAAELAAGVCRLPGATTLDRGFYEAHRRRWEGA